MSTKSSTTFRVEIQCDSPAFNPSHAEVARMLRDLAKRVETWGADHSPMGLKDANGTICGRAAWSPWSAEDTANHYDFPG